ncbi:MAG TPA: hypothetical protein VFT82_02200 [Candidatus Paceibacterota bacterium]|nr:hypothetical protein [Candidatus Paceibacterota bacterium]
METMKQPSGQVERMLKVKVPSIMSAEAQNQLVVFRKALQAVLAIRKFGEDQEMLLTWIDKYSDAFRKAFANMIERDPNYFDGYATLHDIPEEKWKEIEDRTYTNE